MWGKKTQDLLELRGFKKIGADTCLFILSEVVFNEYAADFMVYYFSQEDIREAIKSFENYGPKHHC